MENTDYKQNITVQYCFPENNSSCRKEVRAGPGYIFLFIFLSCVSVCTVFLNLLVIISISHFKQLHTPTNLLILSLAVADLLVGLIIMPVNIMHLKDSCWYLGRPVCSVYLMISYVSMSASLCSLTLIAIDRYIAVCDPLLYSHRVTVCKATLSIILGWSLCLFYNIMYFYFNDALHHSQKSPTCYGECVIVQKYSWLIIDLVLSFGAPCSIIMVLYSIIFKVAVRQAKAVRAVTNVASNNYSSSSSSSETKAAKKLGTVIFVYLACWIPFYISSLWVESFTALSVTWVVLSWLVAFNSSLNPLIYAIVYPWFRVSTKYIVTCRIIKSSSSRVHLLPDHIQLQIRFG